MKHFFEAILFAYFVAALANSSVKPTKSNEMKKTQCNLNNYNSFYAGPNCKKIEQQLTEIRNEIGALRRNKTGAAGGKSVQQQLAEIKKEINALRRNETSGSGGKSVQQQLAEIRNEINALRRNETSGSGGKSVEQQLAELKSEIIALRRNKTCRCAGNKVYKNCAEVYQSGDKISGVYKIDPDGLGEFEVFCDQKTAGGRWTVFQKRRDGSVDFFRAWDDYKRGFGNLNGEFWLGLDKIHRLSVSGSYKLRVDLEDVPGKTAFAEYSSFGVKSEKAKYQLSVGNYSGTARDSLGYHRSMSFSTKDRDNDKYYGNCASRYKGAWWYDSCQDANLNGLYLPGKDDSKGMSWTTWKNNYYSVKRSEMKIRPKEF